MSQVSSVLPAGAGSVRCSVLMGLARLSNKLYLKVADLAALEGDYYKAIENYEKVAKSAVNSNLMKWSVKDYFLKAGICHLATNVRLNTPHPPIPSLGT